ncbi:MAG: tyrosine-type recombinase/integrase [Anaerolineales bacterium]
MPQPTVVEHLDAFLAHIDVARKTETTYRYGLQAFAAFLADPLVASQPAPRTVPASRLQDDSLAQFRHWMRHDRRLSRRTEGTYLAAAIRYVEWLDANSLLQGDITSSQMKLILRNARGRRRVGYKTQPIKESVPLIIQYYDQLPLASAAAPRGRRQRLSTLRNRAIVHTLFATGLRAQELASLRRADCDDGKGDKMLITGKGEKERLVMLNSEAQHAIRVYLQARDADRAAQAKRPTLPGKDEPLFIRHDREQLGTISTKTVWLLVSQAARALGLSTKISPHDFRRYMATTLLSEGMPLESVQAFLGHESIVTTRTVYAHTWSEVLDDQVKTYRPSPSQALRRAKDEPR